MVEEKTNRTKTYIKKGILFLITLIFLVLVFFNIDLKELFQTIKDFDLKYALFLSISIVISLAFRGLCFKILISKTTNPPLKELVPLCITGASLNIVLPARAGDLYRAFFVGEKYNVDKVKILGTIMLERIFDGFIILSMLFLGIFTYHKNELAQNLGIAGTVLFVGSFIVCLIAIKFDKFDVIFNFFRKITNKFPNVLKQISNSLLDFMNKICNSLVAGFEILKYPNKLIGIVFASVGIWVFECLNYWLVIQGFNCEVNWSVILFIIPFIALACMVPSTSIFVGPYQFAVISAFSIYGIVKETALAISLVEQAIVTIVTSLIAMLFLIKNNVQYSDLRQNLENKKI